MTLTEKEFAGARCSITDPKVAAARREIVVGPCPGSPHVAQLLEGKDTKSMVRMVKIFDDNYREPER